MSADEQGANGSVPFASKAIQAMASVMRQSTGNKGSIVCDWHHAWPLSVEAGDPLFRRQSQVLLEGAVAASAIRSAEETPFWNA